MSEIKIIFKTSNIIDMTKSYRISVKTVDNKKVSGFSKNSPCIGDIIKDKLIIDSYYNNSDNSSKSETSSKSNGISEWCFLKTGS